MMKLLTGGNGGRWLAVTATATALVAVTWCAPALAVQQGASHAPRNTHRVPAAASAVSPAEQDILDADDARFFLTRVGFAPNSGEVAQYVGLTREQAVDKVLATVRTEAVTPLPDWVLEPIQTRDIRKTWTDDQRRDEQRLRGQRYELLRAWWVREMLGTPSPLTDRLTLLWRHHFTSGQDKVQYPQQMAQQNMLLRRDALGNFGELLHGVAKDPAMLQYLDGA